MNANIYCRLVLRLLWPCLIAASHGALAADANDAELKKLRGHIESLQQKLDQTRDQRDVARAALRPVERRISQQVRALRASKTELATANKKLGKLHTRQQTAAIALYRQRQQLGQHARAAYALGQQDQLKLLLNQQDPAAFSRVLTYYRYFADARVSRINSLKNDLRQLTQLQNRISHQRQQLLTIQQRRQRESQELNNSRRARATLLASLNRELRSGAEKIARLKRDEKRLDNLMRGLPDSTPRDVTGNKFARARGRLPLPVRGRVTIRFGTRRPLGDLKWKGIFLSTPTGREVKAVFAGRVVFADWLQGYGLLLILEHGDGYMTLYGNNESLTQQVGDQVEAGNVIALTGNTGNIARSGLYFEVRHQGTPRNPLRWCRRG